MHSFCKLTVIMHCCCKNTILFPFKFEPRCMRWSVHNPLVWRMKCPLLYTRSGWDLTKTSVPFQKYFTFENSYSVILSNTSLYQTCNQRAWKLCSGQGRNGALIRRIWIVYIGAYRKRAKCNGARMSILPALREIINKPGNMLRWRSQVDRFSSAFLYSNLSMEEGTRETGSFLLHFTLLPMWRVTWQSSGEAGECGDE